VRYIDPLGLYEFDSSVGKSDREKFKKVLIALENARDYYAKKGDKDKFEALKRTRDAYGNENDGNGVTIAIGKVKKGASAETGFGSTPEGKPLLIKEVNGKYVANVVVTFGSGKNIDLETLAHEGSHVGDHQNFIGALFAAPAPLSDEEAKKLPENVTKYVTESKAYHVSSYIEEYSNSPGDFWNKGWQEADRQKAIDHLLKTNDLYKVTPRDQGRRLYETGP
jgi:hypothetical protein